mgnify:CR=1 FL=1
MKSKSASSSASPLVWSLVLVGLTLGLAACGTKENEPQGSDSKNTSEASQPTTPAPAEATINAAEFFTKADAEAVLGSPVNDPTTQGGVASSNCTYIATNFSGIGLYVRGGTTPTTFDQAQAASKSISNVDPVPVAGMGEKAYWAGGKLNQLNVLKSQYWLIITVFAGGDKSPDLAKQAAEKILARMP